MTGRAQAHRRLARPAAPVATPIEFTELARTDRGGYDLRSIRNRLARKGDPWAKMTEHARSPASAQERLDQSCLS